MSTELIPESTSTDTTSVEKLSNSRIIVMLKSISFIDYAISHFTHSFNDWKTWVNSCLRWRPTSPQELDLAEKKVFSFFKNPFRSYYANIGKGLGLDNNQIWTLEMSPQMSSDENLNDNQKPRTPLVLIHGFGSAVGLWALNLDSLLKTNRKLYAFDILGFGKSSRPEFDKSDGVEFELIDSIEKWRKSVGLNEKFILLGHSFGGYLAASYALQYPEKVEHLVLADPWGMPTQQQNKQLNQYNYQLPLWAKMAAKLIRMFTPLAGMRAAGPVGPTLVHKLRKDIKRKFERLTGEEDSDAFLNYIYHCNAQPMPSGEMAFNALSGNFGWAKNPMIERIHDLHPNIGITFIYGSRSWIDRQPGFQIKYLLGDRVNVEVIPGSGHHVYADKPDEFNSLVAKTCHIIDSKRMSDHNSEDEENISQALVD